MELQTPQIFFDDFITQSKSAKRDILISVMSFEYGKKTKILEKALLGNKNILDTKIYLDYVSLISTNGSFPLINIFDRKIKDNIEMIKLLSKLGVKIHINNEGMLKNIFPLFLRNHIKLFIVDDSQGWIGGINLTDESFKYIDFMVKFTKKRDVLKIKTIFQLQTKNENLKINLDQSTSLLLDIGKFNLSIILDHELLLIQKAKKNILFVSQFVPDSIILESIIKKSHENVKIKILTSNKNNIIFKKFPYKFIYLQFLKRIKNEKNISFIYAKSLSHVHAKYIEIDNNEAIFGSHNLTHISTFLATKELSVYTKNKEICKKFIIT